MNDFKTYQQESAYVSPFSFREKAGRATWEFIWASLCSWTPKPFNSWRLWWLKCFGATIEGRPFVHPRARIHIPWNLTLRDRSCLGDGAQAYSLGEIELGERSTVAQEAYLCTGTHDFAQRALPLRVAKITIGPDAFVSARAFILPGVIVGEGAIVGACAVVTRDVDARERWLQEILPAKLDGDRISRPSSAGGFTLSAIAP
jgi:putative colanic acid biosynthesis acetyltransferase WcaF